MLIITLTLAVIFQAIGLAYCLRHIRLRENDLDATQAELDERREQTADLAVSGREMEMHLQEAAAEIALWRHRAERLEARDIVQADAAKAIRAIEIALSGQDCNRTPAEVLRLAEMAVQRLRNELITDGKTRKP